MNRRKFLAAALAVWLLCCCLMARAMAAPEQESVAVVPDSEQPNVSAACAALVEVESGRVLYTHNGDTKAYMASTTKTMTALLAIENGDLAELVEVPDTAVGTEGSNVYLTRGERMSLNDLLYGLMLVSGNDAAVTIATHIGGNVEDFAALMNARAEELGCRGTHFVNPNGLPHEEHYTTAADLAKIAAAAMRNETFRTIVGTTYHQTSTGDRDRTFKNKNKILWQYEGGNGVKTGFTKAAGRCLVFSAERGGMTLVGTVLNAPDMWNDAMALLDYGFDQIENRVLTNAATPLTQVTVERGKIQTLPVYAAESVSYPLARDGSDVIDWELSCEDRLVAPVSPGAEAGSLTLLVNGIPVKTVPLIVTQSVPSANISDYWKDLVKRWCA